MMKILSFVFIYYGVTIAETPNALSAHTVPKRKNGEEKEVRIDQIEGISTVDQNEENKSKNNTYSIPKQKKVTTPPLLTSSQQNCNTIESILQRQWQGARDWLKCRMNREVDTVSSYLQACARYGLKPDGAICAAATFGSIVARPNSGEFCDGDLLALVETLRPCGFRGIDLSGIDGSKLINAGLTLRTSVRDDLIFLALAPKTRIQAADRFFLSAVSGNCRYLKAARCDLGNRGADALTRVLTTRKAPISLERIDLSHNGIGPIATARLRTAARTRNILINLRGNAAGLDLTCGLIQAIGAILSPLAGFFLVSEARRLELDRGAVASCILYALSASAYFILTAALYLIPATSLNNAITLDAASRIATFLAVAGAHAPFLAFVDLGLPRHLGTWLWATCAALACVNSKRKLSSAKWQRELLSPPALRHASLSHDKVPLVLLAGIVPFLRFIPLKSALAQHHRGFACLVAAVLLAVLATALDLTPLCRPFSCTIHLSAAVLHYLCVLTTLVWHFLPPPTGSTSTAGATPGSNSRNHPPPGDFVSHTLSWLLIESVIVLSL